MRRVHFAEVTAAGEFDRVGNIHQVQLEPDRSGRAASSPKWYESFGGTGGGNGIPQGNLARSSTEPGAAKDQGAVSY
jgi:hypothetical protein